MAQYKNILIGYRNRDKKNPERAYLSIQNVSDQPIVIEPDQKIYLNETPVFVLKKNENAPHYTKSVKIEDEPEPGDEDISDSIPF
jgi:hypothetical protein